MTDGTHHSSGGTAKKLWDKGWKLTDKYLGEPSNRLVGKWGSESFWPTTTDKELDKAARILRVFTIDGGVETKENVVDEHTGKKSKQSVLKKIPQEAMAQAKGIAIFTVFRTGLHWSAASGSGVVLSRLPDGSWSPPSGILVHTLGIGFVVGIDIYDVVLVLNTDQAIQQFCHPRVKLGGEVSVAAGPSGDGRQLEVSRAASWSYTKSKGFYAGVQIDGNIIIERSDENARFYGQKVKAAQILAGQVQKPAAAQGLYQVLAAAQGLETRKDAIPAGLGPSEEHHKVDPSLVEGDGGKQSSMEAPPGYEEAVEGSHGSGPPLPARQEKSGY